MLKTHLDLNLYMFYLELACIHMSTILQFTKSNYLLSYMTVEVIVCAHFAKNMKNEIYYIVYMYKQPFFRSVSFFIVFFFVTNCL